MRPVSDCNIFTGRIVVRVDILTLMGHYHCEDVNWHMPYRVCPRNKGVSHRRRKRGVGGGAAPPII